MRSKRVRKFRSKYYLIINAVKVAFIWYMIILSAVFFTSDTRAYFNDVVMVQGKITVGEWDDEQPPEDTWDKSSLEFAESKDRQVETCGPTQEIKVELKNVGDRDMEGPSTYEVWYSEDGNPKEEKGGIKLDLPEGQGVIEALDSGDSTILSYETSKLGNYKFKAYQRPGHPGPDNGNNENKDVNPWSETIEVVKKGDCTNQENTSETVKDNSTEKSGNENEKKSKENSSKNNEGTKEEQETLTEPPLEEEPQPEQTEETSETNQEPKETEQVPPETKQPNESKPKEEQKKIETKAVKEEVPDSEVNEGDTDES